jgi:hypothetical protein
MYIPLNTGKGKHCPVLNIAPATAETRHLKSQIKMFIQCPSNATDGLLMILATVNGQLLDGS